MLFYEELEGFHHLFSWENYEENRVRIISESLSYSLLISNPLLAIYLANIYPDEVFEQKDTIIDGILHYLNEFTELNGSIRYRYFFNILPFITIYFYRRVKHLEQYLFLIERMLDFFSYSQGKYLIKIFNNLLEVGVINISEVMKNSHLKEGIKYRRLNNYENNMIVYSISPFKDWVMIAYIWK